MTRTRAWYAQCGFGLNREQEIVKKVGVFSRMHWSDGEDEAWVFADVNRTATLRLSVEGEAWHRPDDTFSLAGVANGL